MKINGLTYDVITHILRTNKVNKEKIMSDEYDSLSQEEKNEELWYRCTDGELEDVKKILEAGAELNAADEDGYTGLMHAVYNCYPEIVKFLVDKGADKTARSKDGSNQTAMDLAREYLEEDPDDEENEYIEIVKHLK
ncbi:MAG: ankyrin repeat domain-containing protein [bacterium]|nr:ankyrin repeat domain-containing protein [bacterium]